MFENPLKDKLDAGEHVVGTMVTEIRNPLLVPLLERAGFDFLVVDFEHGTFSHYDLLQFVLAARRSSLTVLARPPGGDYISLAKIWDAGARGILVPRVENPEQVRGIIQASKYPPFGARGYGPRGIVTFMDDSLPADQKIGIINNNSLIFLQVEKKIAVEQIDGLLAPDHINGVIIGPADLSVSLGIPGQFTSDLFCEAVELVLAACNAYQIPMGFHSGDLDLVRYWRSKGASISMYSSPWSLLAGEAKKVVEQLRK